MANEGSSSSDKSRLIEELRRGRGFAIQLQSLLSGAAGEGNEKALLVGEILGEITRSFDEGISTIRSREFPEGSEDVASGDYGESPKRPGTKDGRGSYKRRKGSQSQTVVATTKEDGYAWRKYGQKTILESKYPRCYYRCTHKHDQGCKATKQVQKMDDNPNAYQITYIGQHSCRELMRAPQMIPDSDPWDSNLPDTHCESKPQTFHFDHQDNNPFPSVKDEHKEDSASDLTDCLSGFDQAFPSLPGFGNSADPTLDFSLLSFSDDGFRGFPEMDFMSRYGNFDDGFQFAGGELV